MFKFKLPQWACIDVRSPSGGIQRMVHIGNGEFVSHLPPLFLDTLSPDPINIGTTDITWDSSHFKGQPGSAGTALFNAPQAMDAVKAAASEGDHVAMQVVEKIEAGAKMMEARDAAGLMQ